MTFSPLLTVTSFEPSFPFFPSSSIFFLPFLLSPSYITQYLLPISSFLFYLFFFSPSLPLCFPSCLLIFPPPFATPSSPLLFLLDLSPPYPPRYCFSPSFLLLFFIILSPFFVNLLPSCSSPIRRTLFFIFSACLRFYENLLLRLLFLSPPLYLLPSSPSFSNSLRFLTLLPNFPCHLLISQVPFLHQLLSYTSLTSPHSFA